MTRLKRLLVAALSLAIAAPAVGAERALWHITFDTQWLGPMEATVELVADGDTLRGHSLGGAAAAIRALPGDHLVDKFLLVFEAKADESGEYSGTFLAPWHEGALSLTVDDDTLQGKVEGGAMAGTLSGQRTAQVAPLRDYAAMLGRFDDVVATKIFAPEDLDTDAYRTFRQRFGRIVAAAKDDLDVLLGFHLAWQDGPFSHFQLRRSGQSAEDMFRMFDSYRVGFEAATVEFADGIAILKVRTMMGEDTIEQIEAAYERIAGESPRALVIDLRGNGGGAFAVKPLVEHIIDAPLDAGYFLSQVWNREHDAPPDTAAALAAPVWSGWSIISFWHAVQERGITRLQFHPAEPNFDGPVYVLLDGRSASATELAADAFRASGAATLVGERSAGEMLSQSLFDVADGFVLSLPVADYYSMANGRIEGVGVPVDVEAAPDEALEISKKLIAED